MQAAKESGQSSATADELAGNSCHGTTENALPSNRLKLGFDNLRRSQGNVPSKSSGSSSLPTHADFSPSISLVISQDELDEPVEHMIIYLHEQGGNELSLETLARRLKKALPKSAYLLIRGVEPVPSGSNGYHWADPQSEWNEGFLNASSRLLTVIKNLNSKCNIMPSNIMILGHSQGGMAALAMVASYDGIELGGVISIEGSLPSYVQLPSTVKAQTPALILRAKLGEIDPPALQRIKDTFVTVDVEIRDGPYDKKLDTADVLRPILDFFAHRFHREEWEKQAIVSFDGGGIRGLGSLLILQELMNKVGDEEKRTGREDGYAESSFSPCPYKPIYPNRTRTDSSEVGMLSGATSVGLPNSSLYLPCHYFTYAAGTSTGGLISIMLSRFRMTVDDCIEEYERLGENVFGNPRHMAKGGVLWPKFDAQVFEQVIRDVTSRHRGEAGEFEPTFPSEEDLCKTVVFAYADKHKSDFPYFFRTYGLPSPSTSNYREPKNYGDAPHLRIWQVARATSAAPSYLKPIEVKTGDGSDPICFKDGGFGLNNPTKEAYYDIAEKHGGQSKIGLVLSIGTGETPLNKFPVKKSNLRHFIANARALKKLPSRTLNAHQDMWRLANPDGKNLFPYYRFDGGKSLGKLPMDEWKSHRFTMLTPKSNERGCKTTKKIRDAIRAYLDQREVQDDLVACAKLLVRRRRYRTRDGSKWDRYATASSCKCNLQGCEARWIKTRQEFENHLKNQHGIPAAELAHMQSSRRCWIYRNGPTEPDSSVRHKRGHTSLQNEPAEPAMVSGAINATRKA